jgi:hypothetical protein
MKYVTAVMCSLTHSLNRSIHNDLGPPLNFVFVFFVCALLGVVTHVLFLPIHPSASEVFEAEEEEEEGEESKGEEGDIIIGCSESYDSVATDDDDNGAGSGGLVENPLHNTSTSKREVVEKLV